MVFEIHGKACLSLSEQGFHFKLEFLLSIACFAAAISNSLWVHIPTRHKTTGPTSGLGGLLSWVRELFFLGGCHFECEGIVRTQLYFIRVMTAERRRLPAKGDSGRVRWSSKRMLLHKGLLNLDPGFQRPRRESEFQVLPLLSQAHKGDLCQKLIIIITFEWLHHAIQFCK